MTTEIYECYAKKKKIENIEKEIIYLLTIKQLIDEMVNYITFTAPGLLQNGENHEYALQGISTGTPAPLPSAMLLLGSGVFGLAAIRRKFKS